MSEEKRVCERIETTSYSFERITAPGQAVHATTEGDGHVRIDISGSVEFIGEIIAVLLRNENVKNFTLIRYAHYLDADNNIPPIEKLRKMIYTYNLAKSTLFEDEMKELKKLREKVREQEITIENLSYALSVREGGRE